MDARPIRSELQDQGPRRKRDGSHGAWDESDDRFDVSKGDTLPTVSEWGMMVMTLLTLTAGSMVFRQHRDGRLSNMPI